MKTCITVHKFSNFKFSANEASRERERDRYTMHSYE